VREAIVDGKRQEAEALRLLQEMQETARLESLQEAREESVQQAAVMTPAKVEKWVSPVYPRMAQQAGIEGRVVVEFEVGIDGKATDFVIIESLPAGCDDAAIEAIKRMEFTAATQGGRPVPTRIKMPFMFKKG
jgi:TonB family protein